MEMKIFHNKKHVFWQAFFLTLLFFFLGLVLGVYLEQIRTDNVNTSLYQSEVSLYDSFALGNLLENSLVSCDDLRDASITFADKIYDEARNLEELDDSSKLTESLNVIHKKYDLLRTLLWMNIISIKEKCGDINTVVYLYEYDSQEIQTRSEQAVWSRILEDLKESAGPDMILIPIAVDQDITSLDYLVGSYGINEFPAVIINEEEILYEHESPEELEGHFN